MRFIRPLLLTILVGAATGGALYWWWPDLQPGLAIGFGGLLLLHLHTLARLARLDAQGPAARATARGATPRSGHAKPSNSQQRKKKAKGSGETSTPSRAARPISPATAPAGAGGEEPEKVEEFLKVVLSDQGSEEVSFLPPYASDEADESAFMGAEEMDDAGGALASLSMPDAGDGSDGVVAGHMGDLDEGALPPEAYRNVPIPRHFALGTVAIIRKTLSPAEVAQVLVEQRKRPRERFGEVAVELGLLSDSELEELLVAQQQGLFTDEEIKEARGRIKTFRELEAAASTQ